MEGTDLTWKMTRRATTSTLFIGFPAGDKVRKLLLGRDSSLLLKKATETGDAIGNFHHKLQELCLPKQNIRTRLCLKAPGPLPSLVTLAFSSSSAPRAPKGAGQDAGQPTPSWLFRASFGIDKSILPRPTLKAGLHLTLIPGSEWPPPALGYAGSKALRSW